VRRISLVIVSALLLALHGSLGAAAKPVNLSGPEVVKMDWNTRALDCADIDGDGRNDLGMIDNDSGKIEILFQNNPGSSRHKERKAIKRDRWEPALEDAPFWHDDVAMGQFGYDMALGDLNGDGRVDIVYTGNFTPLTVVYQDANGKWDKSWTYANIKPQESTHTILIADINNDGRKDIAVLTDKELALFYQDASGKMKEPKRYKLSSSQANNLVLADINGDKLPDILYLSGSDKYRRVSARMQQSPGVFGPEIGFKLPVGSAGFAMTHISPKPVFVSIDGQTRTLLTFSLEEGKGLPSSLATTQIRNYATSASGRQGNLYAWGDYDGDGNTDVAVACPSGAEIVLFRQNESGDFEEGRSYPSLSKIGSIATLHVTGKPDRILVTSDGEDVAGIVDYTAQGRLDFPKALPTDGKTVSVCAGNFDGSGKDTIALIEKRADDYFVTNLKSDDAGNWIRASSTKIANVKRKPEGMMSAKIGKNGADVLLVFAVREAARLFAMSDAGFKEIATDSSVRLSGLSGADASRINVCDVDGDGLPELLVGSTGFARALKLTDKNELVVVDQYNSRNTDAEIKGPMLVQFSGSNKKQMLFFDDTDDKIEMLARDNDDGVYRSVETQDGDSQTGFSGMTLVPMGKGRSGAILVTGQDRMGVIPFDKTSWVKKSYYPAYESELKDVGYTTVASGDLNGDGKPEIVAIDGTENLIEVLEEGGVSYESAMHFVVFDINQHANPHPSAIEPRESLIADLNNDGRNDVAILVHDRVLIYTGQVTDTPVK
jgi:hypothetical protein